MAILVEHQQPLRHQVVCSHRFMQVKRNPELPDVQQPPHGYLEDRATELQSIPPHPLSHDYTFRKVPAFRVGG